MNPFLFLWRHRHLILNTTLSDVRARYTGSVLGIAWAVLNPLFLLTVYVLLYVVILNVRLPGISRGHSGLEYTIVIFSGLVPWFGFSEATSNSLNAVVGNSNLVHNTSFPTAVLPVKAVLSSMVGQAVGICLLLILLAATGHLSIYWLLLPLAVATQLALSLGLGWILSSLNVFVRDLGQALSSMLLFLMFVSPIAFTGDFLGQNHWRLLLYLNPLSYVINLYRMPLVYGHAPSMADLVLGPLIALTVFFVGFRFFVRIRPYLADHV